LRVKLDGQDAGFLITLFDPARRKLFERKSRLYREVSLTWVAQLGGDYSLEIRLEDAEAGAGHYVLKSEQAVTAAAQDMTRLAAEKAVAEAENMRAEWSKQLLLRAIKKYEEAGRLWHIVNERGKEACALKDIGDVYLIMSQSRRSLSYYRKALSLSKVAGEHELEIEIINDIGSIEIDLGERQKVLDSCNQSLKLSQQSNNIRGQAQALNNMGLVFYYFRETEKTLDLFNQAIALWKTTTDYRGRAEALANLGYTYSDMGEIHKAMEYLNEALGLWRRAKDRRGQAVVLTNIGFQYTLMGEPQKSLNVYKEAGEIFQAMGDRTGEALILHGDGYIHFVLGEMSKALYSYKRALQIHRILANPARQAITMGHIGAIYDSLGDKQKALYYLKRKLAIDRSLNDPRLTAYTLKDTGLVYDSLGQSDRALDFYRRALALSRAASDPRGQSYALNCIGHIFYRSGKKREALEYFGESLSLLRAAEDRAGEVLTLHNIARVKRDLGDLDGAAKDALAMVEMIESMRAKLDSLELRATYFASAHQHYELTIDVLMKMHRRNPSAGADAAAFEMSERARARGLLEMLNESRIDIRAGADPSLLQRERDLELLLNVKSQRQIGVLSGKHTEQQATDIRKEIADLTARYQEVRAQMRSTSPRYAALTQPKTLTLAEVQQKVLDSGSVLLEYSLGEERSYLWAVTPSTIKSYELPGSEQIEKTARRVRELVAAFQRRDEAALPAADLVAEYWREAGQLSRFLLAPAASDIRGKRLMIVADGILQYISFPGLPSPGNQSAAVPLIVDHEISSAPSASTLAVLRSETEGRARAEHEVAVFADPVFEKNDPRVLAQGKNKQAAVVAGKYRGVNLGPLTKGFRSRSGNTAFPRLLATKQEARMIISHTREGESLLASDFKANRAMAMSPELARYRILHLATHGLFDSEQPEQSAIVLSLVDEQGRPQNGFLRLRDLYNLDLPVDVAVLSACDTALGKSVKGEGMIGITRGFMYAGTARIIASLWKIDDDATAELMDSFYKKMLEEDMRPAAALRAAQIEIYNRKRWQAPFYWAAFTFQGEWK
jgi:CHAT domain-containing protein